MSKLCVAYATVEGRSAKIAEWIAEHARQTGLDAVATDLAQRPQPPPDCDRVVVVASIHSGRHAHCVRDFVREHRAWLSTRPSAFLSVSLGAASQRKESRRAAEELLEGFLASCGWRPDIALPVAGALSYSMHDFLKRRILRTIAKREGPTDTSRHYEFTDWSKLGHTLDDFLAGRASAAGPGQLSEHHRSQQDRSQ